MKKLILSFLILITAFIIIYKMPDKTIGPGQLSEGHAKLTDDCFACHSGFMGISGEKCISCHKLNEIGIKKTTGEPFATVIDLKFSHKEFPTKSCVGCHTDHKGLKPKIALRKFSHEYLPESASTECTSCHKTPLDTMHRDLGGSCKDCHSTKKWTPATFEHSKYFRFDRHHPDKCKDCHIQKSYKEYTCTGCHEHSESKLYKEHREEGITNYQDCVKCHRSGDEDEAKRIWRSLQNDGGAAPFYDKNQEYRSEKKSKHDHDDHDDDHEDDDD